jgi:hypothetical protein
MDMLNLKANHVKKMAILRYKDEILKLHKQKASIREITKIINYKLARVTLKTSLSKSTIANVIKIGNKKHV